MLQRLGIPKVRAATDYQFNLSANLIFSEVTYTCNKIIMVYLYMMFFSLFRYNAITVIGGLATKDTRVSLAKVREF